MVTFRPSVSRARALPAVAEIATLTVGSVSVPPIVTDLSAALTEATFASAAACAASAASFAAAAAVAASVPAFLASAIALSVSALTAYPFASTSAIVVLLEAKS